MRYRFVQDDDCHNYLIPDSLHSEFTSMLEAAEEDRYSTTNLNKELAFIKTFDEYRIDGIEPWTFENPRKDR